MYGISPEQETSNEPLTSGAGNLQRPGPSTLFDRIATSNFRNSNHPPFFAGDHREMPTAQFRFTRDCPMDIFTELFDYRVGNAKFRNTMPYKNLIQHGYGGGCRRMDNG
jgi:hypothetical protein